MKKNIGNVLALYPTPLVVVGTMVDGKPNWTLVGHLGIIGHDLVMVSMASNHYSNTGIRKMNTLSINIVDEALLPKADYVGCVSGSKVDKSEVFDYSIGEGARPFSQTPLCLWPVPWRMSMRPEALSPSSAKLPPPTPTIRR